MSKITLSRVASLINAPTSINGILTQIEQAFDKCLFRDGSSPNQMTYSLDMNSNRILNLPKPSSGDQPLRLADAAELTGVSNSLLLVDYVTLTNYGSLKEALQTGLRVKVPATVTELSIPVADSTYVLPRLYLVEADGPLTLKLAEGVHTTSKITKTGNITSGSVTITGLASTSDLYVGLPVVGPDFGSPAAPSIPTGAIVTKIINPTSVEISQKAATTLSGATISFMVSICNVGANSNITILGATPTAFTTVSSIVDVVAGPSGNPNDWLVTYNLADASGITTNHYLKIDTLRPYTFLAGDYSYLTPRVGCGFTGGASGPYVSGNFPQLVNNEMADLGTLLNPTIKSGSNTVTWSLFYGVYGLLNVQDVLKVGDLITIKGQTRKITSVPSVSIPAGEDRVGPVTVTVDSNWSIDGTSVPVWYLNAPWDSTITTSGESLQVNYGGAISNYFTNNANPGDMLLVNGRLLTITEVSPAGASQYVKVWPSINITSATSYAIVGSALAHEGTFKVTNVSGNQVTVQNKWFGPFPPPKHGVAGGEVCAIKTILKTSDGNSADGFVVRPGGSLGYLDQVALLGGANSVSDSYSQGYGVNLASRINPPSSHYINPTQLSTVGLLNTGSFFASTNWSIGVFLGLGCNYSGFGSHWYANKIFGLWSMEGGTVAARYCIAAANGYYLAPTVAGQLPSQTGRGVAINANSTLLFTLGRSVGNNGFGISLESGATMYSELPIICHNRGTGLLSNGGGSFEAKSAPIMLNGGSGIITSSTTNAEISQVLLAGNMRNGLETSGSSNISATTMWVTGNRNTIINSYSGPATITPSAPSATVGAGSLAAGTYSIRIVAVSADGKKSFISPACANQIVGASSKIDLTWSAVAGASTYEVWVTEITSGSVKSKGVSGTSYSLTSLSTFTAYDSTTNYYNSQDYGYGVFVSQGSVNADYSAAIGNDNSPFAISGVNASLTWQQGLALGSFGSTANGSLVQELARVRLSNSKVDALCAALGTYVWIDGSTPLAGGAVALVDYNPPSGPIGLNNRINGVGDRGDWIKSDDLNGVGANRLRATNGLLIGTTVNSSTLVDYFQPNTYYNSQNVLWGTANTLPSLVLVGNSTQYPEVSLYRDGMSGHPGVSLRLSDTTMYGADVWVWNSGSSASQKVMSFDATNGVTMAKATFTTATYTTLQIGNADTSLTRASAGDVNIAGNIIYRAGGTDVAVADGGTGFSSYTVGDLLYASATGTLSKLADVATGNALISGGVGVAPSWGKIGISTHVSGLGTNVATALGNATNGASGICVQDASGRLGIGTTPSYELDVYRSSTTTVLIAARNDNTSACIYSTGSTSYCGTVTNTFFGFITNNTPRMSISGAGNVYMPSGATNMTTGFFYIPSAAGAPTGTPTAISGTVPMYYDTTNNNFYVYNGAWKKVLLA